MKKSITEKIPIPAEVFCEFSGGIMRCTKGSKTIQKKISVKSTDISIKNGEIVLECSKGNKKNYNQIMSAIAHLKNLFNGLEEKYTYKLESCNVHFPMTLKVEPDKVIINNFLGEKVSREAKILPGVEVKVEGPKITVMSHDLEAAGQTAANLERATKLKGRDRRVFQDGIYIVEKPGRKL